jgi:hypothetical protein
VAYSPSLDDLRKACKQSHFIVNMHSDQPTSLSTMADASSGTTSKEADNISAGSESVSVLDPQSGETLLSSDVGKDVIDLGNLPNDAELPKAQGEGEIPPQSSEGLATGESASEGRTLPATLRVGVDIPVCGSGEDAVDVAVRLINEGLGLAEKRVDQGPGTNGAEAEDAVVKGKGKVEEVKENTNANGSGGKGADAKDKKVKGASWAEECIGLSDEEGPGAERAEDQEDMDSDSEDDMIGGVYVSNADGEIVEMGYEE